MASHNPDCLGHYDFERICLFARKRFIEGCNTIDLLQQAATDREKEEIALVSMLDIDDDVIKNLRLSCRYAVQCKVTDCRAVIKEMIDGALAAARGQG
jgi:hypothetical protein